MLTSRSGRAMLLKIHAVLDDAEEKQVTRRLVKMWLDELQDLAYDVEDILDEFATEALRRELNPEPSKNKLQKFFDGYVGSNRSFVMSMRSKMEDIETRLQRIVMDKNDLELSENTGGRTRTTISRVATTSLVNEGRTYGRDEDKKAIVKLLLSGESSDPQLSVIPILGMGGLGKTTLAQLVFNDHDVSRYFDLKAWVCISEDFDIVRVTKVILQSVTSETCDVQDLNSLQVKLKEKLSGKKFLLILDDVWNEDYDDWTKLRCPFEFGDLGSKIIVTTRNDGVSSIMGTTPAYELKGLSQDACLHVFTQHALGATDFSVHPELEEIGREILERCKGSPLAAKVLGGLLRTKRNLDEWEHVLNSKIWDLPEEKSNIPRILKLSYQYLPSHLKRCFAYCSLFPKDYEFEEKELVLLWMAEGLVQETKGNKPMEKIGGEYFADLHGRSFFQQSNNNDSLFVMHDLINDLAEWAAGDLCYRLEDTMGGNKQSKISTKFLHGRLCISRLENVLDAEDARRANLNDKKNLDELAMKWESADDDLQDAKVAMDVLDMLRPWTTVKELSIDGYVGVKFPTWLGHPSFSNMVLLRIESCRKCTSLPAIGQLPSLKNLVIKGMANVQRVGPEFYGEGCLKPFQSLETLCFEDLQEWKDWIPSGVEYEEFPRLRELSISCCPKLQGKLPYHLPSLVKFSICKCEELVVSIPSLPMLHKLEIVGCKEVVRRNTIELCSLKSIVFSIPDLKSLTEEFMHGLVKVENLTIDDCKELTSMWQDRLMYLVALDIRSCPSLITLNLMSTVRRLTIKGCSVLQSLPISNCTCLEYVTIEECNSLTFISRGQLPSTLKRLEIRNCKNLQLVVDKGEASSSSLLMNEENLNTSVLEQLMISNCPSLKCLSSRGDLPATLKILKIYECLELASLSSSGQLPIALKQLDVSRCPKLESVADKLHNNVSLEHLGISNCEKLKSLPEGLHKLCHLNKILIQRCSSLVSFPDGGLLPTSLRELSIIRCEKLEALPNRMHNLTSLHTLFICNCPNIISFPEEVYPTNLTSLVLSGVNICKQVFEWGLHRLTSLTILRIDGDGEFPDWQSFPSEEEDGKMMMTLPTSLTQLWIWDLPNIVFLSSKGFQNLSALQELFIRKCPKLKFLPEKDLPPSLLQLRILDCPLLEQHYKKGKGREWLKTANIPFVMIDGRNMSKLEGKAVNASQALNYYKHMVMICQEAMAGNHSLRRCQALVQFEPYLLYLRKACWLHLYLPVALRFAAFVVENRQAGRYKLLSKTLLAVLHQRSSKLWFRQVPRPILTNACQQTAKQFNSFSKSDFPKFKFLPKKGLTPSLLDLYIYNCPLLKQHCKKGKGREWFKIANIPCVKIDDRAVWFGSNLTLRSDLFNPLLHYGLDSKLVTEIKNNNDTWTNLFYTFATTGCGQFEILKNKAATEGSEINAVSMLDYRICPFLKEAFNASQALNYCKHMIMICQEAMAGNHSLRRCKASVCNWTCFVDCREWQLASANFGGSWYQKRESLVRCRLSMQRF
uniref:Disease resistance RPP13-like protein 1 n=1 Tax=Fagus sylvatica TaxID=28930 RepID=A0A2N9GMR7_FAGSY